MPDKKEKKEMGAAGLEIGFLIFMVFVVAAWSSISEYLEVLFTAFGGQEVWHFITLYTGAYAPGIISFLKGAVGLFIGVSFPVSLFFLIAIVYCVEQIKHIRRKEEEKYDLKVEPAYEVNVKGQGNAVLADRWGKVQTLISSENHNDWRQAILEADIMLEDVLTSLGYQGEGIGEKLKRVELGDMKTRQDAWDAHLIRNRIAHDGTEFPLTKYEAQNTINLYKKVFEEFYYI